MIAYIAILLFSGWVKEQDISQEAFDVGRSDKISYTWPVVFVRVNALHEKCLNGRNVQQIETYHPNLSALHGVISSMCEDSICALQKAIFSLRFVVEARLQTYYLKIYKRSTRVLYAYIQEETVEQNLDDDTDIHFYIDIY